MFSARAAPAQESQVKTDIRLSSFFGKFTILAGTYIIGLIQILTGIALYFAFGYLRPSLHFTMWALAAGFIVSAIIGFYGAYNKNYPVEVVYFVTFVICTVYLFLCVLDFSDVVQLMPKAPVGASEALFLNVPTKVHRVEKPVLSAPLYSEVKSNANNHALLIKILQHQLPGKTIEMAKDIYDQLPFVPHNETEGQSEEISKGELPPEAEELSPEAQAEVIAITKMQKRPMKLLCAAIFGLLFLFYLYFNLVILTFVLNKCKSLDVLGLTEAQFQPLFHD